MHEKLSVSKNKRHQNPVLFFIFFIAVIAAVAILANLLTNRTFLDILNVKIIVSNSVYPTFIAWGLCFLFACGYYDLSLGSVVILASYGANVLGNLYGYPGVVIGGVVAGTFLVFLNSSIFVFTKVPTWIASLCLTLVYEAIAIFLRANKVTRLYVDVELNRDYRAIGNVPVNLILLVAGFIIIYIVYNRTTIGLNIRAVGGNKDVSRALGVNTLKMSLWTGLICGLIIGVASVVQQSHNVKTPVMTALTSLQLMFKPLAIALLAQILQKRINIIIAVPFCSLIIYGVFNLMTFFHVPSGTLQEVFLCVFVAAFGIIGQRGVKEVVK